VPRQPKATPPADWIGWDPPQYTPIPDALFDVWLPLLTEGQLKVLLYIMRRTFGFKKAADAISLSQLCEGIVTADGRRLDAGTGCTRSTVTAAVAALVGYGLITATPQTDARGDAAPTLYRLRMAGEVGSPTNRLPQSNERTTLSPANGPPVVQPSDSQETVVQDTENKKEEEGPALAVVLAAYGGAWGTLQPLAMRICAARGWTPAQLAAALTAGPELGLRAKLRALEQG
jgi:hypothetical protein